ncbi:MAG: DUF6293 family protein [Thermoplasmata archaeon]
MRGRTSLISILGLGSQRLMAAVRVLAYDRLILVVGRGVEEDPSYRRIIHLESFSKQPVTSVLVDLFDFRQCFSTMNELITDYNRPPDRAIVNIAGGTKLLANAALLAAFQNGVEVYHMDEELIKLPVILGLRVRDRFSPAEIEVARAVRDGDTLPTLLARVSRKGLDDTSLKRCLRRLHDAGVIRLSLHNGRITVHWPPETGLLREVLMA